MIVIDKDIDFLLREEFRMLRLDLARQPEFLREEIMKYEETLLFMLIEDGVIHDVLESIRRRPVILVTRLEETPEGSPSSRGKHSVVRQKGTDEARQLKILGEKEAQK